MGAKKKASYFLAKPISKKRTNKKLRKTDTVTISATFTVKLNGSTPDGAKKVLEVYLDSMRRQIGLDNLYSGVGPEVESVEVL